MKSQLLAHRLFVAGLLAAPLAAQAGNSAPAVGGETTVKLDASFVEALGSLHVTPAAIGPARLYNYKNAVYAAFPITTGAIDTADTRAEIDHSGGLSLRAGSTTVSLTDLLIEVTGPGPALTGLVSVNGKLVGRIPLFDLSLRGAHVWAENHFVDINGVDLKLSTTAAEALSGAFHTGIPDLAVGTAEVRTVVAYNGGL